MELPMTSSLLNVRHYSRKPAWDTVLMQALWGRHLYLLTNNFMEAS